MPEDVACPDCAQQPHEECRWGDVPAHPRFHTSRIEAASFCAGVEAGTDGVANVATDAQIDAALDRAAEQMF